MTEKVMITKEQDDAIEEYMNKHKCSKETILDLHAANYKNNLTGGSMQWSDPFRSMNELSVSDMARALYIGYEVEPKYCVGKWVVVTDGFDEVGRISKITKVSGRSALLEGVNNCWWGFSQIRYATESEIAAEKERRFWNRHGREVWELKQDDLLISRNYPNSGDIKIVEASDETGTLLINGYADDFVENEGVMKKKYRIVCFAESRLDGDTNENLPN